MPHTEISCTPSAPTLHSAALYGRASTVSVQLGQRIRDLRQALAFTLEELAEKADISVSFLSMIERAERVPHIKTLVSLAAALGITLSKLFLDLKRTTGERRADTSPSPTRIPWNFTS